SLALVDALGNGAMVCGFHIHGGDTRVYAKPLTQWHSSYSLGAEEQQALGRARQMIDGAPANGAPSNEVQAAVTPSGGTPSGTG
ncbi:MAG: DUF4446 family protein, partial [Anaerolineae bacterium]